MAIKRNPKANTMILVCVKSANEYLFKEGYYYEAELRDTMYVTSTDTELDLTTNDVIYKHGEPGNEYWFVVSEHIRAISDKGTVYVEPEAVKEYKELKEHVMQMVEGLCTVTECVFKCYEAGWNIQFTNALETTLTKVNMDVIANVCDHQMPQMTAVSIKHAEY